MSKIILEDSTMTNIADAIRSKNGETGQYLPSEMPAKIEAIQTGGSGIPRATAKYAYHKNSPETNLTQEEIDNYVLATKRMFYNRTALESIDTIDGKKLVIVNPEYMFYNCSNLTSLDVSKFNTSGVTSTEYMFYNCSKLTSLDVSNFDTSNVTNMNYTFYKCSNLTSLDVSNFDTSNVIDMRYMFYNCSKLTSLDVSNFDTSNVTNMDYMFNSCKNLTTIDISNFNMINITAMRDIFCYCSNLLKLRIPNIQRYNSNFSLFNEYCSKCNDFQFSNNGTFGSNYSGSSTLSLVYIWRGASDDIAEGHDKTNGYFYEAFANSIGKNESSYTKTIKLYTTLYDSLSDEQKALLTNKGYTITYGTS